MKRILILALSLALLAGCGTAIEAPEAPTTEASTIIAATETAPATAPATSSIPLELTIEFTTDDVDADFTFDFGPRPDFTDLPGMLLRTSALVRNVQLVSMTFGGDEVFMYLYLPQTAFVPIDAFTPEQTLLMTNYITIGSSVFDGFWLEDESGTRRLFYFALHTGSRLTGDPEADRFYTLRENTDTPIARFVHEE